MKTRRLAIAASSLLGLVLLGTTLHAPAAGVPASLTLDGAAIAGAPVSFSGHGSPSSSARIVVIPAAGFDVVGAVPRAPNAFACYLGSPTALGTADVTTDSSGNIGPTLTWGAAVPGSYRGLLLQGSCSPNGRNTEAASDQLIVASDPFTVGASVPALSAWGFAALGLALSVAGWTLLSRTRA